MADGDDAADVLDLESFGDVMKVAEPKAGLAPLDIEKRFALFNRSQTGKINRREYVRTILFERLCNLSMRAVDTFLRMDADRTGNVSMESFVKGIRSLGLTLDQGFTDADVEALFRALDLVCLFVRSAVTPVHLH